jgi:hypothetical protein
MKNIDPPIRTDPLLLDGPDPVYAVILPTAPLLLEVHREHFEKDHNPMFLMMAFRDARLYNWPIPEWVLEGINRAFTSYVSSDKITLDEAFKCTKGQGQDPAKTDYDRRGRDVLLVTVVDALRRDNRMAITHACIVAQAYCRILSLLPADDDRHVETHVLALQEVREKYYKWKPQLDKITVYPEYFVEDIIDLVLLKASDKNLDKIRKLKRYSTLFQLHSPDRIRSEYPSLFETRF